MVFLLIWTSAKKDASDLTLCNGSWDGELMGNCLPLWVIIEALTPDKPLHSSFCS